MGRWRPRPPPSSPYITAAGFAALEAESRQLWEKRSTVVKALAAAAAEGDRSENAEYIYRKKELAGIDRRIRYLQKRMPVLRVIRDFARGDRVYFGAVVDLETESGEQLSYRIVGPDETGAADHYISMDSPLARSLLKKGRDDEVRVTVGEDIAVYVITAVRYPD